MSEFEEFQEFPKIARLSRGCVITEKIDGTNAQLFIERIVGMAAPGDMERTEEGGLCKWNERSQEFYVLRAGSRNRWITPETDNFGFARWAYDNVATLVDGLGEGRHFGEWWGSGVQRGYGLAKGEKRFSLFNVSRWHAIGDVPFETKLGDPRLPSKFSTEAPPCCSVVPVLHVGPFDTAAIADILESLAINGSAAAPGFMQPEGIVIWHEAARVLFKKTLEKDDEPKGPRR